MLTTQEHDAIVAGWMHKLDNERGHYRRTLLDLQRWLANGLEAHRRERHEVAGERLELALERLASELARTEGYVR